MKFITLEQLNEILDHHRKQLNGEKGGECANLRKGRTQRHQSQKGRSQKCQWQHGK